MDNHHQQEFSPAWYHGSREEFLSAPRDSIANQLAGRASDESLVIEPAQTEEWRRSVELLQRHLDERIPILREALSGPGCEAIHDVILEFDFRRRGLRMDCILLADGVIFVVEFKRNELSRADRDQVMNYAINLLEFHKATQDWCAQHRGIVVPVLTLTTGTCKVSPKWTGLGGHSWPSLAHRPTECDRTSLGHALQLGLGSANSRATISRLAWLESTFRPSSSIIDATLSLFGNHDVTAIQEHAAPKAAIDASALEIRAVIEDALSRQEYHVVFLSGAPGAGKTLVGLDLVMRGAHAGNSVFVTGNAPLVEVLNSALGSSYKEQGRRGGIHAATGYQRRDAAFVANAASFKIVKAHNFLGKRGHAHRQEDGRVLVFDEAQRTYEKGRTVLGEKLADHEADLILGVQRGAFPAGGSVVVALIGHNQAINRGERGIKAWLEAAESHGWTFSIADETLNLAEIADAERWASHPSRRRIANGHLHQSMRFYRNSAVEEWVGAVLDGRTAAAEEHATKLAAHDNIIWMTRSLATARKWAKPQAIGGQRAGIIASGQARRLAAEGLFVDHKPDIATWMLAPTTDIRSSNALETVQNQYQIQGLELDHCIVCWDADLRREGGKWVAYKLSGSDWQRDQLLDVAKNGYRVILTRARKGMVIFIPTGDLSGEDPTRTPSFYDGVAGYLLAAGARELPE